MTIALGIVGDLIMFVVHLAIDRFHQCLYGEVPA